MSFVKMLGGVGVAIVVMMGAGCAASTNTNWQLGDQVEMSVGEIVIFSDGPTVELTAINDSRCQPGVVCVWEGELSPVLTLSGGKLNSAVEITLGTSRTNSTTAGPYTVLLQQATATTATIVVQ